MNATELPSPGLVTGSHALRKEVARVISQVQVASTMSTNSTQKADDLIIFFKAALNALKRIKHKQQSKEIDNEA